MVADLGAEQVLDQAGNARGAQEAGHLLESTLEHALREDGELRACRLDEILLILLEIKEHPKEP